MPQRPVVLTGLSYKYYMHRYKNFNQMILESYDLTNILVSPSAQALVRLGFEIDIKSEYIAKTCDSETDVMYVRLAPNKIIRRKDSKPHEATPEIIYDVLGRGKIYRHIGTPDHYNSRLIGQLWTDGTISSRVWHESEFRYASIKIYHDILSAIQFLNEFGFDVDTTVDEDLHEERVDKGLTDTINELW